MLPERARRLLDDARTRVVVSAASVWELSIKQRAGKLELPDGYCDVLLGSEIQFLAIGERDGWEAATFAGRPCW